MTFSFFFFNFESNDNNRKCSWLTAIKCNYFEHVLPGVLAYSSCRKIMRKNANNLELVCCHALNSVINIVPIKIVSIILLTKPTPMLRIKNARFIAMHQVALFVWVLFGATSCVACGKLLRWQFKIMEKSSSTTISRVKFTRKHWVQCVEQLQHTKPSKLVDLFCVTHRSRFFIKSPAFIANKWPRHLTLVTIWAVCSPAEPGATRMRN